MSDCLFCKIIAGEIPGNAVFENDKVYAFRDINPQAPVHVLVVPKKHMDNILQCDAGTAAALTDAVKHARAKKLIEIGNQLECEFVQGLLDSCQQVLFEQAVGEGLSEGYTGQYVRVRAAAKPGELCRVRIDGAEGTLAFGTVIEHEQEEDTDE